MSNLIDRNIVNQALTEYIEGLNECTDNISPASLLMGVQGIIRTIPNAEKTGKWIQVSVSSGRDSWKCSVCGRRARGKTKNLPYCHCGALMEATE